VETKLYPLSEVSSEVSGGKGDAARGLHRGLDWQPAIDLAIKRQRHVIDGDVRVTDRQATDEVVVSVRVTRDEERTKELHSGHGHVHFCCHVRLCIMNDNSLA